MPDWTKSMKQTFEYYEVDPETWQDIKLLTNVKGATISRDAEVLTLGSSIIDVTGTVGECYIRVYLVTDQNGIVEKHPLGTFLAQTPVTSFDGKTRTVSMDAYTPLLELKEKSPPVGFFIPKDSSIGSIVTKLVDENARAPVVDLNTTEKIQYDFVAEIADTWLDYLTDLLANVGHTFSLDEMSRIIFATDQDVSAMQPVWTYDDSNSSILYSDVSMNHDLYGIPNVVEVCYFNDKTGQNIIRTAVNNDPNSPTSTTRRGRQIVYRVTDPDIPGLPDDDVEGGNLIQQYANDTLRMLSSVEYRISYTHGYCPVRLGDCVRLNYERAGLTNIKAKVVSQSIKCEPGCPVTENAIFTARLWG